MMPRGAQAPWRVIDTGERSAAANIALDATMLELGARSAIPGTLRFLGFEPSAALIGYHQRLSQELRLPYCEAKGIDTNRRITGGGAVLIDSGQLGWELIGRRSDIDCGPTMADLTAAICEGAALGLAELGVTAAFRPRNDIEVDGRKLCGTGGAYEGDAFLFQGTLLIDSDLETMLSALRVPTEKLARHELERARDRVVNLTECLIASPSLSDIRGALIAGFTARTGLRFEPADLSREEEDLAAARAEYYASAEWTGSDSFDGDGTMLLNGAHQAGGGLVRAAAALDHERGRVRSVLFSGDFFIAPQRAVYDLECSMREMPCGELESHIADFFASREIDAIGLDHNDFWQALRKALEKVQALELGVPADQADAVTLVGAKGHGGLAWAVANAAALLLPYCAKLPQCEYRDHDGCDECGDCSVGAAYGLAGELGIEVITIHDYGHLGRELAALRSAGARSYLGCCCQAFQIKRHRIFATAGMTGVLIDIEDDTCYDLEREQDAYRGRFENQTTIRTGLLRTLLAHAGSRRETAGDTADPCMGRPLTEQR